MQARILNRNDARAFILAGNAEFGVRSLKTDKHYTFNVKHKKTELNKVDVWFVFVERHEQKPLYLGWIRPGSLFVKKHTEPGTAAHLAFKWFWEHALTDDEQWKKCELYHLGRCARCNRRLTDPISISTGLGPICAGR